MLAEEDGKTTLSCLVEFGWNGNEPIRGWNLSGCADTGTCRYTPEMYQKNSERNENKDWDWDYPNITTAFGTSTALRAEFQDTNYIVYNRGLWVALQPEKAKIMIEAFRNMTGGKDETSNRCFFKSTTGCGRSRDNNFDLNEYGHVRKTTYEVGCEYFDVAHVTDVFSRLIFNPKAPSQVASEYMHVFWDSVHYVSAVFFRECKPFYRFLHLVL